ncbi:hypothetical protein D3C72_1791540 [compost metagenome]
MIGQGYIAVFTLGYKTTGATHQERCIASFVLKQDDLLAFLNRILHAGKQIQREYWR